MKNPTYAQSQVLAFVVRIEAETGQTPTVREICAQFGFHSTTAARCHLAALERRGCITRRPYYPRGVSSTDAGRAYVLSLGGKAA